MGTAPGQPRVDDRSVKIPSGVDLMTYEQVRRRVLFHGTHNMNSGMSCSFGDPTGANIYSGIDYNQACREMSAIGLSTVEFLGRRVRKP
ncbi:hypothetical protein P691DRAFT_807911 [Macrolepiota fuliginosa MF-IS2]|uniref:Uncharacterized protein n=1 Tax=Macrolepiota fuliginosa MF-IS2 TaxID=1400762 RepID=A0A9P6C062_9AGAR|nr:hypothetical protein P691DRAFT_807911 [Macrolepiota fuliginosa MF-IS2]